MKRELSAGGVILRKRKGGWEVLIVQDMKDQWTFPKGKVESGEEAVDAAKREITEEVGIRDVTLRAELPRVEYWYQRDGLVKKTVHYFVFTSQGEETLVNQLAEGIHNAQWMPIDKAIEIIGYPKTNKDLLWKSKKLLI